MGLYRLAHELGWSVAKLCDELSLREFYGWVEYFSRINGGGAGGVPAGPPVIELATATAADLKALF